jgi:hypothetical protein
MLATAQKRSRRAIAPARGYTTTYLVKADFMPQSYWWQLHATRHRTRRFAVASRPKVSHAAV